MKQKVKDATRAKPGLALREAAIVLRRGGGRLSAKGHFHDPALLVAQRIKDALDPSKRRSAPETGPDLVAKVAAEKGVAVAGPRICVVEGCGALAKKSFCYAHFMVLLPGHKAMLFRRKTHRETYAERVAMAKRWLEENRSRVVRQVLYYRVRGWNVQGRR